jgi:hypothetical protein
MIQQQEFSGSRGRGSEDTTAEVFRFPWQGIRRYSSRKLEVPVAGDQKLQQQNSPGSCGRASEARAAGVFRFPRQEIRSYSSRSL